MMFSKVKNMLKPLALASALFMYVLPTDGQNFAVKTNLLYDATTTINAGVEVGLSPRWTLDVSGNYNPWEFSDNRKWKHWLVQPEARWWMCNKFMGSFLGFHALGGQYNVGNIPSDFKFLGTDFGKLEDSRYQGWMLGAGVTYGYDWAVANHFNIEFELGLGVVYSKYDQFECPECGKKQGSGDHFYVGPTKVAISLVYVF